MVCRADPQVDQPTESQGWTRRGSTPTPVWIDAPLTGDFLMKVLMIGQQHGSLKLEPTFTIMWLFCRITPCYLARGSKDWKVGLSGTLSMVTDIFSFDLRESCCDKTDALVLLLLTDSNTLISKATESKPLTCSTLF